jgi:acetate kinase
MKELVINCGSSSLKYTVFEMPEGKELCNGIFQQLTTDKPTFTHKLPNAEGKMVKVENDTPLTPMADHADAIKILVKALTDPEKGVMKDIGEIKAVGHRVLHGGSKFSGSVRVNEAVKEAIIECIPLGPLHNPANLKGINAFEELLPGVPQVAVFDTAFHQTMPDYAYMYALPYKYYEEDGIRRYGFHGTSHRYVSERCIDLLGNPEHSKIVSCHLGNGSSISAVVDGKCLDTTMGLTPLEGIMMGTRCGSIDPAIVTTIMKKEGLTPDEMDSLMNKKSGMLGLSGTSDNRTIESRAKEGDERAKLVESMFCHQLTKYIGSFAAAMGGVDAVLFTGGIGENNPQYRTRVAEKLKFLGVEIDEEKNALRGKEIEISTPDSKVKLFVIPTNEELMIAKDTYELL